MNDPVRPSGFFERAGAHTAPTGVLATLSNPPPEIARLPNGTTLPGLVLGQDGKGQTTIRTELGTLSVASRVALSPGSEVVLQVRSSGAQLHVLVMHSEPPPGALARPAPAAPVAPPAAVPPSTVAPAILAIGQTVAAMVHAAPAAGSETAGATATGQAEPAAPPKQAVELPRLPPGSEVRVRILAVLPPAGQAVAGAPSGGAAPAPTGIASATPPAAGAGPLTPSGTPGYSGPTAGGSAPQSPGAASPAPPAGSTMVPPHPATPGRPGAAPAAPPPASAPPSIGAPGPLQAPRRGAAGAPAGMPAPGPRPAPEAAVAARSLVGRGGGAAATPGLTPPAAAASAQPQAARPAASSGNAPVAPPRTLWTNPSGSPAPGAAGDSGRLELEAGNGAVRFSAVLRTVTAAGLPVLASPLGTLSLQARAPLPPDSRLILELDLASLPPLAEDADARRAPSDLLGRAWATLEESVRSLHELGAAGAAEAAAARALPQPGPRLASSLLFLLAALRGGELGAWLGAPAVEALRGAGREGLAARLGQDFAQVGRLAEAGGGDWRVLYVPLLNGEQVEQLRVYLRDGGRGRSGPDGEDAAPATRFILEVELIRLGDLQLDGLVHGRRFDLVLRTRQPLPGRMRDDIARIFHEATEAGGYAGAVGFQASSDWSFLRLAQPAQPASPGFLA